MHANALVSSVTCVVFKHFYVYECLNFSKLQNKDKSTSNFKFVGQNPNCCSRIHGPRFNDFNYMLVKR